MRPVIPQTRPGTDRGELRSLRQGVSRMGDATIGRLRIHKGGLRGDDWDCEIDDDDEKRSDTWKMLMHSYITPEEFTICDLKSF